MNTRSTKKNNPPSSNTNVKNNKNEIYKKMPNSTEMYYNSHQTPHNTYNEDYINEIVVQLNSSLDSNGKLEVEARKLRDELDKYKIMCDKYNEKYVELLTKNNEETNQRDVAIRNLKSEIKEREQRLKDVQRLENRVQHLEKEKEELEVKNNNLVQRNGNLETQLEDLTKQNALLEDEASSYQSALGVATNFQLGDDDQNNAVNLNGDILELNDNIKKYITNLKQDIIVNMEEVKKLLLLYNCPTRIQNQKEDRLLIQAVLHRHVMEKIFEYASQYFQSTGKHYHLESDIAKNESTLSLLLIHASKCRSGNDEVTRVGPSKLRQQIYSVLSNRGFADIIGVGKTLHEHPFIAYHKEKLNKIMNELRVINSNQKKITSENLAATIIRKVVKIFWFRLKVQEPVVQYRWIQNNTLVDKTLVEVANLDDKDEVVNSYVDLCFFPLIGRDIDSNNRKIYTLAKVIAKPTSNLRASTRQQRNY
ncbi:uncharacterized protein OCT59_009893 [Rhizophagus irregularis]|uniref:Uncharacterized protein n=1 Tax=Rhizophagus irregularis (strain DAOM 181602 / DAOM 197198 / MUCL 43194) TaxID=747089 RepID=A0A2H5SG12_RHIID|nr:hypothetical protein GLOIN_2v1847773 [Rhizophagus irregularis DAOM 181602=DAOM 197198]POG60141.1 hypothetical protein GLOIN_2v1847773 [Rhizophagus irregularis DAOM 181602=DAOM 197198]UZO18581.1 hypothetical protein OCT59_009893 [Rhizophagus irregularis]GBC29292.1 hypothetical protein GLOIN_2v1847773 [Rhizophagus irregularis DAOM 181602=DAOM 197198]CAG8625430.1 6257_t:CDS:1 [Rhizophagus irregularis]|eukprot:XP_025167007.1 hypothetical protein GLOIN_2v1847773 [Rhizophagus irregularis DAOM 181602=DAOM 197198]